MEFLLILHNMKKKQKINIKKKINEVKKNYVSPYSKKIIENNLYI